MFILIFVLILLSNYIVVANINENSKLLYFTMLVIIGTIAAVLKILG